MRVTVLRQPLVVGVDRPAATGEVASIAGGRRMRAVTLTAMTPGMAWMRAAISSAETPWPKLRLAKLYWWRSAVTMAA